VDVFPAGDAARCASNMIDEKTSIQLIHMACDNIEPYWRDHLEFWEDEEAGYYNDAAVFAHYVVDEYQKGDTEDFNEIFKAIEKIIEYGNEAARGIAVVGFLEAIQNIASHKSCGPNVFMKWLGSKSTQAWHELNELWKGKSSLADVKRSQK
jgi:hypothetical protein